MTSNEIETERLLTTRDVMKIFGRTDRSIRNWVYCGRLHPIRIGRSVYFKSTEVGALFTGGNAVLQSYWNAKMRSR